MVNRLLINMTNKIATIDSAIDQCKRLMNDEVIELNGLHKLKIDRNGTPDKWFIDRIKELKEERFNLALRVNRMS